MYLKSLKKFNRLSFWHQDKIGIKKGMLAIYDFFTFYKEKSTRILSNHINLKRDYLNKNNKVWYTYEDGKAVSLAFEELMEVLKEKTIRILNKTTEIIFYHKHHKGSLMKLIEKENLA